MKRLRLIVPLLALVGLLSACDEGLVDIPPEEFSQETEQN